MPKNNSFMFLKEIVKTVVLIVLFVFVIRNYVIQPFYVVGSSMEPTYHNNDYLIIDELTYHLFSPRRGDAIVLKHPTQECDAYIDQNFFSKFGQTEPCKNYIKRIIALPGETVRVREGGVSVKPKGGSGYNALNENYIGFNIPTLGSIEKTLGNDEYFVIGDNREPNASSDSREWGSLKRNHIVGKVWLRILPKFTWVKGPGYNK
jgi:signal peptidase I